MQVQCREEDPVNLAHLRSQFRGCLLGGAVSDALGMPTEEGTSRTPGHSILQTFGVERVEEYLDSHSSDFLNAGQYTDDTQQTICLAETYLEGDGQFAPERFYRRLSAAVRAKMRGVGPSTIRVLNALAAGQLQELLSGELASGRRPAATISSAFLHSGRSLIRARGARGQVT